VFSIVKIAYALDEASFYDKVRVQLELRANNLDSFSRLKNYPATIALNVGMLVVFFGVMYLLFPSLRTTVFGLFTSSKPAQDQPAYTEVEMTDTAAHSDAAPLSQSS
jgi:hypothetical protein